MANPQLVDYIRSQLAVGVAKDDLRKAIADAGWISADAQAAFDVVEGKAPPIAQPQPMRPEAPIQPRAIQPAQPIRPVLPRRRRRVLPWLLVILLVVVVLAAAVYFVPPLRAGVEKLFGFTPAAPTATLISVQETVSTTTPTAVPAASSTSTTTPTAAATSSATTTP